MAFYRYLFCDLRTNAVLAELPLSGVTFSRQLNGVGSLSATLALADPKLVALDWVDATLPDRTAIYVDRDGVLIWGGVLWKRGRSGGGVMSIGADEFESYLAARIIATARTYIGADPLVMAAQLVSDAQQGAGDIGITLNGETSPLLATADYQPSDQRFVLAEIQALSQQSPGFDFAVDVAYVSGLPTRTLTLSYPRRGVPQAASGLVFEAPGNVVSADIQEDGTQFATQVWGAGAGSGPTMVQAVAANAGLLTAGYPVVDAVFADKAQADPVGLASRCQAKVAIMGQPVLLPTLQVRADQDPVLGSYTLGDEALLRMLTTDFPAAAGQTWGLYQAFRITAIGVAPPSGTTAEVVTLTMGPTL